MPTVLTYIVLSTSCFGSLKFLCFWPWLDYGTLMETCTYEYGSTAIKVYDIILDDIWRKCSYGCLFSFQPSEWFMQGSSSRDFRKQQQTKGRLRKRNRGNQSWTESALPLAQVANLGQGQIVTKVKVQGQTIVHVHHQTTVHRIRSKSLTWINLRMWVRVNKFKHQSHHQHLYQHHCFHFKQLDLMITFVITTYGYLT